MMNGVLLVLVCSGGGRVVCACVCVRGRRENQDKGKGINEEGFELLRHDTRSSHCRPCRPLFVLRDHNSVIG